MAEDCCGIGPPVNAAVNAAVNAPVTAPPRIRHANGQRLNRGP
jgi:hypothetical protein